MLLGCYSNSYNRMDYEGRAFTQVIEIIQTEGSIQPLILCTSGSTGFGWAGSIGPIGSVGSIVSPGGKYSGMSLL